MACAKVCLRVMRCQRRSTEHHQHRQDGGSGQKRKSEADGGRLDVESQFQTEEVQNSKEEATVIFAPTP